MQIILLTEKMTMNKIEQDYLDEGYDRMKDNKATETIKCEICKEETKEVYKLDDMLVCVHCYSHSKEMDNLESGD